jgi:hypothetical protein
MQIKYVNVAVDYSNMKSETDLKSELGQNISISMAKSKSGKEDTIFSLLKKKRPNVKMLMCTLLTIRPTSTMELDRTLFSIAYLTMLSEGQNI